MQLTVFGLGNPGKKYELTLHNAGFEATDRLAAFLGGKTRKRCLRRYKAFSAQEGTAGIVQDVLIVQPLTFMNSSGVIAHWFDLKDEGNTVVAVCDNMDLEPGMVRVRWVQSRSTHKGLRSLQENMPDVRILAVFVGIGRPAEGVSVPDHVLSRPADEQKMKLFIEGVENASRALEMLAMGGSVTDVQFEFNKKQKI